MKVQIEIKQISVKEGVNIYDYSTYPGHGFYELEQCGTISLVVVTKDALVWNLGNYDQIPLTLPDQPELVELVSDPIPQVSEEFALKMLAVSLKTPTIKL